MMGFPEAFRFTTPAGPVVLLQISKDTFLELQPATARRPPGITHFGLQVENAAVAKEVFGQRGVTVGQTIVGSTGAIFSNIDDPNGIRVELLEFPPQSALRQAMERWR
jgi:hypothetical protein